MLSKLKDDILRLLKEDEEFRYAVVGLLGLQRLEEAVIRLIDMQAKVESRLARVEEEQISIKAKMDRLEEVVARLVDIQARQEERLTKVEERLVKVEERLVRVEERLVKVEKRLEEHDRKFNEIMEELKDLRRISNEHAKILAEHAKILDKHTRRFDDIVGMMLHGFEQMERFAGISLESLVRSILTKVMQDDGELPRDKELTSITIDSEEIEIFCDDPLMVGEVTSYADSIDEVYKLVNKVRLVRDRFDKEPKLILLIITNIKREVYDDMVREAESNGIEVIIGKRV